ncbi:Smr/MutS family protein [bacterium]|nr:Smr/MutS family protein [bacterium]
MRSGRRGNKAIKKTPSSPEDLPDKIIVTDVLDLHGFFPEQIPEVMDAFLENALELGIREVRIIHGKGSSRLKFEVISILKVDERVVRFGDAPPFEGGWGATVATLIEL